MRTARILAGLLVLVGCCQRGEYTIVILNDTDALITEACVSLNGFNSLGGAIAPHFEAGHGGITTPMPDTVVVQWRSSDGVLHRKAVSVRGVKPQEFAGEPEYWFVIRPNATVEVRGSRPK